MSTGQQSTPSTNAIRDEVRRTVQQLGELARTERDFDQFCETVLANIVKITGAHGALFWQLGSDRVPKLTHQFGKYPHETAKKITDPDNPRHRNAVLEVVSRKQPVGLSSEAFLAGEQVDGDQQRDATFLMLFSPVFDRSQSCCGTLELLQRGDVSPQAQEGYLRFINQVANLFQRWHEQQDLAKLTENVDQWDERMKFISEVHSSIDPTETAYAIANEGRRLLRCDRVSVGRWNGRRCKIQAISSQDRFDNRANVVRLLSNVATASVSAETRFWVKGETDGLAPEVARKINEYQDEAHCRTLIVIPLLAKPPEVPDLEMRSRRQEKPRKLGALILEYFDADVPESQIEQDCQLIVEQSELALENARRHNEIFLQPLWKRMGWLQQTLFRDHFAKTMTALSALAIVTLLMVFLPMELKMKVDGVMQPTVRKTIFSQTEGRIAEVFVDQHDEVTAGQLLLEVEDPDLEGQIESMQLEIAALGYSIQTAASQLNSSRTDQNEREELANAIESYRLQQDVARRQLDILKRKKSYQRVVSPIDGVVLSRQPKRLLQDLPATRDQALLEVADIDGQWQLELKIPEGRVGYVDEAFEASGGQPLPVEFKIATNPNLTLTGTLKEIDYRAVMSEEGVAEFRALVEIDQDQLRAELRSGAGATARIMCGKRSLGFVCFYQVYDFVRTRLLF